MPAPPQDLSLVVLDQTLLGQFIDWIGYSGEDCIADNGPVKGKTKEIEVRLSPERELELIQFWKKTPFFAFSRVVDTLEDVYMECPLVVEIYAWKAQRPRLLPNLWRIVYDHCTERGYDYSLLVVTTNKLRLGLKTAAGAEEFRRASLPEFEAHGLMVKDERTQQRLLRAGDTSDTESDASVMSESGQRALCSTMYPGT